MVDFVDIVRSPNKSKGEVVIYPNFLYKEDIQDIMFRGGKFYAVWDESSKMWSVNEMTVKTIVDKELWDEYSSKDESFNVRVETLGDSSSGRWLKYQTYAKYFPDNYHVLNDKLIFQNTEVKKEDYSSKRLPYSLRDGDILAYDELMGVLYDEGERRKLEWAIGAIVSGDSRDIQKFVVLYGPAGAGKSTVLNIIQQLFEGYYTTFEAKALGTGRSEFATEVFRSNPLVAIQHDGDLSKIEDNTLLNSIISHEEIVMHEKYKSAYSFRPHCFIFMGTNKPVKITDAKSGIIRRLIDVMPSGRRLPAVKYQALMSQVKFELGAIAKHCLDVYRNLGKNYYDSYVPFEMMYKTDAFFNFVESNYFVFKEEDGVSLAQAYAMYKEYCDDSGSEYKLPRYKFRDELMNYFRVFQKVIRIDGKQVRSYYSGFRSEKFEMGDEVEKKEDHQSALVLDKTTSILDDILADCPAQYATSDGKPKLKWDNVKTKLRDLDTTKLHYVKLPKNHIVIDFDLRGEDGQKSAEKCLSEATKWPLTYAEFSQGGKGLHLHYYWENEPERLSRLYSDGIEIKVFTGNSSLRRRLSYCNDVDIATLSDGLPIKEEKVINREVVQNEKNMRSLIKRNLKKEIHPGTKPSIDFIFKILEDAYSAGVKYDLSDMKMDVLTFATRSTNQAEYCVKLVNKMHFKSDDPSESKGDAKGEIIFLDIEVFPNLFLVNWKKAGEDQEVVRMINPSPSEIEDLFSYKIIGFNNRRYDNHILYARYLGYDNKQLYDLSQKIINNDRNAMFGEAYNLSYADVYDFCAKKQSLKKWEIELGIHHKELGLPWDQPVPEDRWNEVAEYCDNDVIATEAVFNNRQEDFVAREFLAELAGGLVNETNLILAGKFFFGNDPKPQSKFVYTDLSEMFPGYKYDAGKSSYRGEDPSEGGYVYAEPGIYFDVALLDIASMHPTSMDNLNIFGPYTQKLRDLKACRIAIKHEDFDTAGKLLDGAMKPFLESGKYSGEALSYALKILINSIYGFTSAKFENKFRDPRNKDNIVAKRGALFMIDLKHAVQEKGFTVAHIKTDSIKIPEATPEIIQFVMEFGKKYGYTFEYEATYSQMCLVNDAVYIAKYGWAEKESKIGKWEAVGAQFQQPYVFKSLFSREPIEFGDMCETKTVSTALYLDMNEGFPEDKHCYQFVGKAGQFCPIKPGCGGGILLREKEGKFYAATGTKGYRWLESETLKAIDGYLDLIDRSYYDGLVDEAVNAISKYGDFEVFRSYVKQELPF